MDNLIIDSSELSEFLQGSGFAYEMKALMAQQKTVWTFLNEGYKSLNSVKTKSFEFDGFEVKVQFNPGRILSTGAKVDPKSISERPCFLCRRNLPELQRGLAYYNDFTVLCNPYPILPEHFTIPKVEHLPQLLMPRLETMLNLAKDISKFYTLLFNGPRCGASAPDHNHFQSGTKYFLPVETDYSKLKNQLILPIFESDQLKIFCSKNYLRDFISFESGSRKEIIKGMNYLIRTMKKFDSDPDEPKINVLTDFVDGIWRVIVFPRSNHRPKQYFAEGREKLMISPATIDMGGVLITPREKDFDKISKDSAADIYKQVSLPKEQFVFLAESLKKLSL